MANKLTFSDYKEIAYINPYNPVAGFVDTLINIEDYRLFIDYDYAFFLDLRIFKLGKPTVIEIENGKLTKKLFFFKEKQIPKDIPIVDGLHISQELNDCIIIQVMLNYDVDYAIYLKKIMDSEIKLEDYNIELTKEAIDYMELINE